ncbi:MAG: (2Fe-2S)-binding protein [Actinomycetota bacterium]|nr:(2Fe-2S)-binding protein [Actinomycetota bacterium]MDQ2958318.1 (2Fe-2S)-binding protein [Actinomycetota bacterium]
MTETEHQITLYVNGIPLEATVPARRLLSDCLRHDLGLTGTHVGCEHGVCGSCTVLIDGVPMRSCLLLAVGVHEQRITTVEGLAGDDGSLSPVQRAFAECHGLQCGFCTPGFLTMITAGLAENPDPSPDEARELIGGNLCRCTGYQNIVASVLKAAEIIQAEANSTAANAAEDSAAELIRAKPNSTAAGAAEGSAAEIVQTGAAEKAEQGESG